MIRLLLLITIFYSFTGFSQTAKYFISFKDKPVSSTLLENPINFLSQKAIDRREKFLIPITENDLPVNQIYVDSLTQLGATVWYTSRWLNGAYVALDNTTLEKVKSLGFVTVVEAMELALSGGTQQIQSIDYGSAYDQNQSIGITQMHQANFTGKGVSIAIIDGGFKNTNTLTAFNQLSIKGTYDFVTKSKNVYDDHPHGMQVLSVLAANEDGKLVGGAYDSEYYLLRSENVSSEYRIEEYNWVLAAEYSDSVGVDMIVSSLGYFDFDNAVQNYTQSQLDGKTALISKMAEIAVSKGILVVVSAGNEGNSYWKNITFPADNENVLAVGAVNENGIATNFTSIGFVNSSSVKPNVSAYGYQVSLLSETGTVIQQNGTSFAAPLVGALLAGLMEEYPLITPNEWITILEKSSSLANNPDEKRGYGIPNYQLAKQYINNDQITFLNQNEINVYPTLLNVSDHQITISSNFVAKKISIQLMDALGKELYFSEMEYQKKLSIPFHSFGSNVLLLKVVIEKNVFIKKIILF